MRDIILSYLRQENVSSVLSVSEVSFKELSCMEVRYIKDSMVCRAKVFYTAAWVCGSPFGPSMVDKTGAYINVDCNTFADIADITTYSSVYELKKVPAVRDLDIEMLYDAFDRKARDYAMKVFALCDCAVVIAEFSFLPMPMVVASLMNEEGFLGSVSISMQGDVDALISYSPTLYDLVSLLQKRGLNPSKEFGVYEY